MFFAGMKGYYGRALNVKKTGLEGMAPGRQKPCLKVLTIRILNINFIHTISAAPP
jgi:hypothetical protein